ncbi:unnamed protein product [Cuscuta epithymum]|uniref:Carboxypeptidase n=1 Tax=Cuscuta epithymum TaxID=186058 RepID=A0AAV0DN29_9ASTE|nr:unnamed protein product [Cuscuta epithymum]CAH9127681.1 unnamed protein product [Cuscuta epithymum]
MLKMSLLSIVGLLVYVKLLLYCSLAAGAGFATGVTHIPGYDGLLPFQLETGYIGVGEPQEEVQLFYYFIKSESPTRPDKDPVILWLTGGPGCSGLWSVTFDNGPLRFIEAEYNGSIPTLTLNPYAWTKVANIIFLDLPVGTGFSYANSSHPKHSDDTHAGIHGTQFIQKWLEGHPDYISNDLYVGGESYAGIFVPIMTTYISDGIETGATPWINLKGYLLGNPLAFQFNYTPNNYQIPFAHGMGLISNDFYESLQYHCRGDSQDIDSSNLLCLQNLITFYEGYDELYTSHILEPACHDVSVSRKAPVCHKDYKNGNYLKQFNPPRRSLGRRSNLSLSPKAKCRDHWYSLMERWANEQSVRKALHVKKGTVDVWEFCRSNLSYTQNIESVTSYHAHLSKKGYRSLIYSGDHDPCITFISTEAWIKALNYSIVDDWRPWWVDDQVGGYTMTYSNGMTYATVKGAGHTTPESAPYQSFIMFTNWIQNGVL